MPYWYEDLMQDVGITPSERRLIEAANTGTTSDISTARAVEAIYTVKKQLHMVDQLIKSNTELAASNDSHNRHLKWLTVALVIVGVAQVVATMLR